jgi:hypothetical protein
MNRDFVGEATMATATMRLGSMLSLMTLLGKSLSRKRASRLAVIEAMWVGLVGPSLLTRRTCATIPPKGRALRAGREQTVGKWVAVKVRMEGCLVLGRADVEGTRGVMA